jgi:glycosyltransferase involved in cell wall biosynthesis
VIAPPRVLMTADAVGGVWTHALDLAAALVDRGAEVVIATMGAPLDRDQRAAAARAGVRLRQSSFRLEWMEDPWDDVERAGRWLLELEASEEPDVIHLNGFCHGDLPWSAPVVVAGHSGAWSWWRAVHGGEPADWNEYRVRAAAGLRAAHRVVAPSGAMLRALEDSYGPLPHGCVVWSGRRAAPVSAAGESIVFSAGRLWDAAKKLAALDRAARGPSWPVAVAGDARHPGGGELRARHLDLLGRLGADEVARWIARAAVDAAPARHEPFGLGPLEAAQAGCAPVPRDVASLREVWGDAAWFAPPGDAQALAAALERVIADQPLRARLCGAAPARAGELEPDRMARQYLDVYAEAAAAARRAPTPPPACAEAFRS